jgi:hypothetical protein
MKSPLFVAPIHFIPVNFTFFHLNISILILFPTAKGQVAVWSWFPPPAAWESDCSGCNWLTWTEQCDSVFLKILSDAHAAPVQVKESPDLLLSEKKIAWTEGCPHLD